MTIDLSRFHQTFFDESFEGLDTMESALLQWTPDEADSETVNVIFRAAHSIKGGAATFGFTAVAEFTHLVETLLDEVRSGLRDAGPTEIDLLLRSVDVLRGLLVAAKDSEVVDTDAVAAVAAELQALLDADAAPPAPSPEETAVVTPGWHIRFVPFPGMYASGNDPTRILAELARCGDMSVVCRSESLPSLSDISPECSYLSWDITLRGGCTRAEIDEVFAWVEDDCELQIEPLVADVPAPPAPAAVIEAAPAMSTEAPRAAVTPISAARATEPKPPASRADSGSIRVSTDKIDGLINLVGELVITQAMLQQLAATLDPVQYEKVLNGLALLDRNTRRLQEAVMSTRMLPVDFVFSRFPRMVRDLATRLDKQVRLQLVGEQTELDKSVIERIADPLTHLVRNALDHGIETAEARQQAGKEVVGTLRLSAEHQGGNIVIQVSDDGRGLDRGRILAKARERGLDAPDSLSDDDVYRLIFAPGFSTADAVTDVSGRGVGMDVVKKNIEALSGSVDIQSTPGHGSRVTIRLPLTLAILDGMSVRVGDEIFIVPLNAVVESLQPRTDQLRRIAQQGQVVRVRSEYVPVVSLGELFGFPASAQRPEEGILVLLESDGRKVAALVDELVGQQQVVIKSVEDNYRRIAGISGATILGDGRVALIVDIGDLVRRSHLPAAA